MKSPPVSTRVLVSCFGKRRARNWKIENGFPPRIRLRRFQLRLWLWRHYNGAKKWSLVESMLGFSSHESPTSPLINRACLPRSRTSSIPWGNLDSLIPSTIIPFNDENKIPKYSWWLYFLSRKCIGFAVQVVFLTQVTQLPFKKRTLRETIRFRWHWNVTAILPYR